jgi:hypothetical protein
MTLKQTGLHPTRRNDVWAMLGALELVAGSRLQLGEIVRAEVRQRMTFEPSPQIFDRIQIGSVGRQERYLNMPICTVQVIPYQFRPVRLETIPDNQKRLLEVSFEHLEKFDGLFFFDAAFSPIRRRLCLYDKRTTEAQLEVGQQHLAPDAANDDMLLAPVELVCFARLELQGYEGFDNSSTSVYPPTPDELGDAAIVAIKSQILKFSI